MLISMLGAGYVGLVSAACLAHLGHDVRCVEIDRSRLATLRGGGMPIDEPGLAELVAEGLGAGRLSFHATQGATHGTELAIVAVDTLDAEGRWTDRSVRSAVRALAGDRQAPRDIVLRSTLMPGTARALLDEARALDGRVQVAHNPEFTREGSAVSDFLAPDRVVVGVEDGDGAAPLASALVELYRPLPAAVVITDLSSAEAIKVGSNVFLAAKIAFANELARICAAAGADVETVVDAIGLDRRIGRAFLSPGPGFGGACLPSQSRELPAVASRLGVNAPLMAAIDASNGEAAAWHVERLAAALDRPLEAATVALLGLTFKAGTDDLRESPALAIARRLAGRGVRLRLYDPTGARGAARDLSAGGASAEQAPTALDAARGADAVLIATEWPEFRAIDWKGVAAAMRGRLVFDARNVVDRDAAVAAGLDLVVLGRRAASRSAPVRAGESLR